MTTISRRSASSTRARRASTSRASLRPSRKTSRRVAASVDVVLVDDREIAKLAGIYRGSPRPTDVLAFCYDDGCSLSGMRGQRGSPGPDAEIFISVDTARRQARERRVPLENELALLCVHGLLHVGGFDDESPVAWRAMKKAEFETVMRIL